MEDLNDWLATATPAQIVERLERAEREAFLWHVVSVLGGMTPEAVKQITDVAENLRQGGYVRPQ